MKISSISVSRPITTMMVFLAVVLLGMVAYTRLPVQLIPDITFPQIRINLWGIDGSAEENVETHTRNLEGIVAELHGVRRIHSFTGANWTGINVEFDYDVDIQYTLVDLQERLNSYRQTLPDRRVQLNAFPFATADFQRSYMWLSVRGPGDLRTLFAMASDKVEQQLQSIDGVASVEMQGVDEPSVEILIDTDLLASYRLDLGSVIGRVQAAAAQDIFLGTLDTPEGRHYVRIDDRISTANELADLYVDNRGITRLRDISSIDPERSTRRWVSRRDGKNSISVSLEREAGRNLIELARDTRKRVEEINQTLPPGMEVLIEEDLAKYVEDAIGEVKFLAIVGALLALLVPLIFFRSLRVSLIVFVSVPVSLIAVFNLFHGFGMSINVFSIVGLALGVGMLVDNSIVVTENALRLRGTGLGPRESASQGGSEVQRGLIAATATTVAVFVPLLFHSSELKEVIREPALALVFPLIISLTVALTLAPVLVFYTLHTVKRPPKKWGRIGRLLGTCYRILLKASLRHRGGLILAVTAVVLFTWYGDFRDLQQSTVAREPARNYISFAFRPLTGATLEETDRSARMLEARLAQIQFIESFAVSFSNERGWSWLELKPREEREDQISYRDLRENLFDTIGDIPGLALTWWHQDEVSSPAQQVNVGTEGVIQLKGLDRSVLLPYAERLIDALRIIPSIESASLKEDPSLPVYLGLLDRERARLFDVRAEHVARYAAATRGTGTISSLQLIDGDNRTNVFFTVAGTEGETLDAIKAMPVQTPGAGRVPLGELLRFQASQQHRFIYRLDRQQSLAVSFFYDSKANVSTILSQIKEIVPHLPNPAGITLEFDDEIRRLEQREEDFLFLLMIGALLVYIVMAAAFESFWVPFTIFATNPLMLIGIVWGLRLTGLPMDEMVFFGILLLVGLAVNNGIVMMDRALEWQRRGYRRVRAVYEACLTRFRPVMMTYLTTTLGLLPLAMVGSEDEHWRPLAVTVIGGLTSATLLTLVVLPSFYLMGDDFMAWARPVGRRIGASIVEFLEAGVNIAFHPIRVLRGELPLLPETRHVFGAALVFLGRTIALPVRLLLPFLGDMRHVLRTLFGRLRPTKRQIRRRERIDRGEVIPPSLPRRFLRLLWRPVRFLFRILFRVLFFPFHLAARAAWWLLPRRTRNWMANFRRPAQVTAADIDTAPDASPPPPVQCSNIHVSYRPLLASWLPKGLAPSNEGGRIVEALKGVIALDGAALCMERGLYGVLGPNGAGKTTLLRCIAGLHEPDRGTVRLFGLPHRDAPELLAPLVGYLPQRFGLYEEMSLYEYLHYFAALTARTVRRAQALRGELPPALREQLERLAALHDPVERHRAIVQAAEQVNLADVLDRRLAAFSGGMKQRAGIARVLLQRPPIVIVDEPTAGLDPIERVRVRLLLARLAEQRLVIFSTHIVEDLERACERLCIIAQGRIVFEGQPEELRAAWQGSIWSIPIDTGTPAETMHAAIRARGGRILFHSVVQGRTAVRVVSTELPHPAAQPVSPTLEEALLATLGSGNGDNGRAQP